MPQGGLIGRPRLEIRVRRERVPEDSTSWYSYSDAGKELGFVVEKKINEIELGYIVYEGKDIIIDLIINGYAKLRGDKLGCEHMD